MNSKGKRVGTKAEIRAARERIGKLLTAFFLIAVLVVVIVSIYFGYSFFNPPQNQNDNLPSEPRATIVDQASLSPAGGINEAFIGNTTAILKQAGYKVDYYPGEQVTVQLFRDLPQHGYSIIILRCHSTAAILQGEEYAETPVCIFTSESYSKTKYLTEQLDDQLLAGSYNMPNPPYIFALTPNFITRSANGNFHNATIIMTGCEGLNNTKMARAFIQKGAKVYIGWDAAIFFSHTDTATVSLLQHLLQENQTIGQAVTNTMKEVGPDPACDSIMTYYPPEAANLAVRPDEGTK